MNRGRIFYAEPKYRRHRRAALSADRYGTRMARLHYWYLRQLGVPAYYARTVIVDMLMAGADGDTRRIPTMERAS